MESLWCIGIFVLLAQITSYVGVDAMYGKCTHSTLFPHPYDIRKYFACKDSVVQELQCLKGYFFNENTMSCIPVVNDDIEFKHEKHLSKFSLTRNICGKTMELFIKKLNNFLQSMLVKKVCNDWIAVMQEFLGNVYISFNNTLNSLHTSIIADKNDVGISPTGTADLFYYNDRQRLTTNIEGQLNEEDNEPLPECEPPKPSCDGTYTYAPDPTNCRFYYICVYNVYSWRRICPFNFRFDPVAKTCVPPKERECVQWQKPAHCS